jgi:ATP-dependent helicase HrpA
MRQPPRRPPPPHGRRRYRRSSFPSRCRSRRAATTSPRRLRAHPAIVVCGETGSGKTTQLPEDRAGDGPRRRRRRRPDRPHPAAPDRRLERRPRIAEELKTPLGEVVGYKVRFQDRLSAGASVKLMTDGILLAETQSDPLLRAYDTIIVDEAHERSLNIDFLLGHLRQILPRRPDLKIVVTSATIDADRFASHFAVGGVPAPVLQVSGGSIRSRSAGAVRGKPRPRPRRRDLRRRRRAVAQARPAAAGSGDVLVFLPGEREIRDAAES